MRSRALLLSLLAWSCGCSSKGAASTPDAAMDATGGGAGMDATSDALADGLTPLAACTDVAGPFAPLSTRCGQLVDSAGRVVILRGVNARVLGVFEDDLGPGKVPLETIPTLDADDFAQMRAIGFNVLRLPMQWSGVEPVDTAGDGGTPTYDDSYLDTVAATVALAKAQGIAVVLDLHQDAYSKYIGEDGAPLWAIQPPPTEILQGPLSEGPNRATSAQVLNAFSTFFTDGDVTGQGLRARYAAMIAHVATHFAGDTTVIGLELYNEPNDDDEQNTAFAGTIGAAVRAADGARLVFFDAPALRNEVDHASIPSAPLDVTGVVYAPHVYTHVFVQGDDSAWLDTFTYDDISPSNSSARDEATGWQAPLFIGEFGWNPTDSHFTAYIGDELRAQDAVMASSTFWLWKEESGGYWGLFDVDAGPDGGVDGGEVTWTLRPSAAQIFFRVQPRAIAGRPEGWFWDPTSGAFSLTYVGDPAVTAPTVIFVPAARQIVGGDRSVSITCDGAPVSWTRDPSLFGDIAVGCAGAGTHVVQVGGVIAVAP